MICCKGRDGEAREVWLTFTMIHTAAGAWFFSMWLYFWYWSYSGGKTWKPATNIYSYRVGFRFKKRVFIAVMPVMSELSRGGRTELCRSVSVCVCVQLCLYTSVFSLVLNCMHVLVIISARPYIEHTYVSWSLQARSIRWAPCRAARGLRCTC